MKLIDALKEKGNPFWIPDCSRTDLPELFTQLGFTTGVEVGVSSGSNIISYLKAGLTMYGVDPYMDYEIHSLTPTDPPTIQPMKGTEKKAEYLKKRYPDYTLIKKSSMDSLAEFADRSLDFVYIDASHKYGHVAMDLMEWPQKIKRGELYQDMITIATLSVEQIGVLNRQLTVLLRLLVLIISGYWGANNQKRVKEEITR